MTQEYQVLARRTRPQRFCDVIAQEAIIETLKNAMQLKRIAHAYLFSGSKGTGKTTLARLLAKALNCHFLSSNYEPCTTCPSCKEIAASHSLDVLEIDGASHRGIEDVRHITETMAFIPVGGRYKIYLIDEVHMLTKEAFNGLLKTLEEPPPHVKFLFCTTEAHKLPATILSRCQRFNLRRIPLESLQFKLRDIAREMGKEISEEALTLIAERAEGSFRDALSLFDQISAYAPASITALTVREALGLPSKETLFSLDAAGKVGDMKAAFRLTEEIYSSGKNISYFIEELLAHFRTLFLIKQGTPHPDLRYQQAATSYQIPQLALILEILFEGQQSLKTAPSERCGLEIILLKILRTHQQLSLESLVERLIALENRLSLSEDPTPQPDEIPAKTNPHPPSAPSVPLLSTPPTQKEEIPSVKEKKTPLSIQEQGRFDTIMRFAAKELNGSLKKEP